MVLKNGLLFVGKMQIQFLNSLMAAVGIVSLRLFLLHINIRRLTSTSCRFYAY